jgi:phage tail tape-measure protein
MNSDGLSDFGQGAFAGAGTGATIGSAAGPYGTAIGAGVGAIAGGTLSYFGGKSQRSLERKANSQSLTLGNLEITEARKKAALEADRRRRQELFGQMLAQYFQKQGAK